MYKKTPVNNQCNWYVVYTYPKQEKNLRNILERNNIRCYLPTHEVVRQWSDRKKKVEMPLFPNYIFIHLPKKNIFKVIGTPGISRFVTFNGQNAIISEDEIELIRKMILLPGVMVENEISKGDRVRITNGTFSGLEGIVFEIKGKKRFGLKIESINQFISIEVSKSMAEKILEPEGTRGVVL